MQLSDVLYDQSPMIFYKLIMEHKSGFWILNYKIWILTFNPNFV